MISSRGLPCKVVVALAAIVSTADAQSSRHALRFHGTGTAQADRARISIDDDAPGPNASAPCDVGAGDFTIEFWVRGEIADNSAPATGVAGSYDDARWRAGNMLLDRDILGASERGFGISLAGGCVRFGTGSGDGALTDVENTLEGDRVVLDGAWHHIACVRESGDGVKSIYVDGLLDIAGPPGVSTINLSYPNAGVAAPNDWGPFIVLAAEKQDVGPESPPFDGFLDELRIWRVARSAGEISSMKDRVLVPPVDELVGAYRFEEGAGTALADTSEAGSPAGELIAGIVGNGEWVHFTDDPSMTAPVTSGALPPGFERFALTSGLSQATGLRFTPDGRAFIITRTGLIVIVESLVLQPTPLLAIDTNTQNGERGLVGLAIDPDFASNGYIYVYYTTHAPRNRVSRFTVVGNTASLASEFVVWENPDLASDYHHGGGLAFGADGKLYITTGDQFQSASSQDLSKHHGKILRVNSDGTVPNDNPFIGTPGAAPHVWARGLRNPFRMKVDPVTGDMWISDVGGNTGTSAEELNLGVAGANFGWPDQEGQQCAIGDCSGIEFPKYSYTHDDPLYAPGEQQAAIIAGPVYRGGAFPAEYTENLFIADYANRWIRRLVFDSFGEVIADPLFQMPPTSGSLVDLAEGPDGALYALTMNALFLIEYTGTTNQPPIAAASASPTQGPTPLNVQFQGSDSNDPDSAPLPLTYSWSFGDHTTSSLPNPMHAYNAPGVHYAVLTVNDGSSQSSTTPIQILAGNPPVATITSPAPGTTYRAGDTIVFAGQASDIEDGMLGASAFSWQVLLVHAAHTHPFYGPIDGVLGGSFEIPVTGHNPADTHYEIHLDVHDSHDLPASDAQALEPIVWPVSFATLPEGIPIFIDGEPRIPPHAFASLEGYEHELRAQPSFVVGGVEYTFFRWSTRGRDLETCWTVPPGGGEVTAIYRKAPARPPLRR